MRELETAIGLDGSFAQAHVALGRAYAAAGDPAGALAPLDRAIGLDPHDPHPWAFYHDRAEACFALGRLAEAERFSRTAAALPNATHFAHATLVAAAISRTRKHRHVSGSPGSFAGFLTTPLTRD